MQDWSSYKEVFGASTNEDVLGPSYTGAFGIEYQANNVLENQNNNAFKLGIYKVGFRYSQTPLQIDNTTLTELGMSFGASLPLRFSGSGSSLNFGVELGQRGTTDGGLIQENFAAFRVGVSIMPGRFDNWFLKRKYN